MKEIELFSTSALRGHEVQPMRCQPMLLNRDKKNKKSQLQAARNRGGCNR